MLTSLNRESYLLTHKKEAAGSPSSRRNSANGLTAESVPLDATAQVEHAIDPLPHLGISLVQVRHVTELQLCKKAQTSIHKNVQLFTNLETLWLNDNSIRRIENLTPKLAGKHAPVTEDIRGCFRLKRLYLSNNKIVSLTGDLAKLKYIEVLLLANNLLSNMETVSAQLKHLGRLQQLDLFGNPLSEEQRYRPYFIYHHPSIQVLDRLHVTADERADADKMFRERSTGRSDTAGQDAQEESVYAFGGSIRLEDIPPMHRATEISLSVALLETRVGAIKARKHADEVREANREQTILDDIGGKRKAFHGVWEFAGKDPIAVHQVAAPVAPGGKIVAQSPAPKPSQQASPTALSPTDGNPNAAREIQQIVTRDRHQSNIFTADPSTSKDIASIRRLVDLQEQLDASRLDPNATERTQRLVKELRALRHLMIPERLGDTFTDVLSAKKAATFSDDIAEYLRKMSQEVFLLPHELANLRKMFPADTAPNFNSNSVDGLLGALDKSSQPAIAAPLLCNAFRANAGLPALESTTITTTSGSKGGGVGGGKKAVAPSPQLIGGSKQQQQQQSAAVEESPLDIRQALALLVCYLPFAKSRAAYLVDYTNKLLLKELQPETARLYFKKINEANEHVRLLEKNLELQQRRPASAALHRFVNVTSLSQTALPVGALF